MGKPEALLGGSVDCIDVQMDFLGEKLYQCENLLESGLETKPD
jgi:hypothetical protein